MNFLASSRRKLRDLPRKVRELFRAFFALIAKEFRAFRASPLRWLASVLLRIFIFLKKIVVGLLIAPVAAIRASWRWLVDLTLKRLWSGLWRAAIVLVVVAAGGFFMAVHWPHSQVPEVEPPVRIVYLDQGWGVGRAAAERQLYYYTPQGAATALRNLRYSWMVNLELPWGRDRLASPEQMRAYGFQVDNEPTPANPYQLPVGFTRHYDTVLEEEVLDLSCAACHTGALRVRKSDGSLLSLRIDGGQAMHAFTSAQMPNFVPVLITSMLSTYLNPLKFNRFARKVLGSDHYAEGRAPLRREFKDNMLALLQFGANEITHGLAPVDEGYARTDALTRIANRVFGDHITPANNRPANAPVNYPPVWDIWKFDWVQYSGSVAQPMARNLGESLGVGADFNLLDRYNRPLPEHRQFDTSTRIPDLYKIETALQHLRPPVWPEEHLGEIDKAKAVNGGLLFIRTCQGCHGPHPASERQRKIEMPLKTASDPHWAMKLLSVQDIGTSPLAARNFVERKFDLSQLGMSIESVREVVAAEWEQRVRRTLAYDYPERDSECSDSANTAVDPNCADWTRDNAALRAEMTRNLDEINLASTTNGQALNYIGLLMRKKVYADLELTEDEIQEYNGFGALDIPQVVLAYKARPLAGAWSTAPYLHNGSVRNLYQLLLPQHQRDAQFFIGRSEFDPVQVGLAGAEKNRGGMWYDTALTGNANTGHEFRDGYTLWQEGSAPQYGVIGPRYSDRERYQIIEYVKTHLDDPPHSTLFDEVFAGVVAAAADSLPPAGQAAAVAESWPDVQACNLREYLDNHDGAQTLTDEVRSQMEAIQSTLEAYFALPQSYRCDDHRPFQVGGASDGF